jgi:Tol biopolymer transport system component
VAFVAPQSGVNGRSSEPPFALNTLFGPTTAYAHGIPWDPWVVNVDGSGLRRVAETGADEPSVAWSPDQTQLFVYSGTGSYSVEVASALVTPYSFIQGYGPVVWLATNS